MLAFLFSDDLYLITTPHPHPTHPQIIIFWTLIYILTFVFGVLIYVQQIDLSVLGFLNIANLKGDDVFQ